MLFAVIVFFLSLAGIVSLFALKMYEQKRGVVLSPDIRAKADERARELQRLLIEGRKELSKVPPEMMRLSRETVRVGALKAAELARLLEGKAHKLADLVSHKHRFERRDTQSEFLKTMRGYALRPTIRAKGGDDGTGKDERKHE